MTLLAVDLILINNNELDQNVIIYTCLVNFHISGYNVRIWGSEYRHDFVEHQCDSQIKRVV